MKTAFALALGALWLGACATAPQSLPDPDSPGAKTYRSRCSGCHALPHPGRHTAASWRHLLALMERRMQERSLPPLTDQERRAILDYLAAHAR